MKPVKEHIRRFAIQKRKAIGEEVARLLAAEFIREIYHSEWLANVFISPRQSHDDFSRISVCSNPLVGDLAAKPVFA